MSQSSVTLTRDCKAVQIPSGDPITLRAGTPVTVTQTLGGAYTVLAPSLGGLYRIDGRDADALGLVSASETATAAKKASSAPVSEDLVWQELKSCYDPEIPVNIVDLGLVYDLHLEPHPDGGSRVEVKMTLTAPGCGMGTAIASDAQQKIERIPGVREASVAVVWDPPWNAEMMSDDGKRTLGIR